MGTLFSYASSRRRTTAIFVVALVNGESATVKRFFREKNCIRLQPENDSMEPFYETDVQVLGKVIGLYRHI